MEQKNVTGVFEGGGVRGVAIAGAVAAAQDSGVIFDRVIGTSAGALVASLIAAGYTSSELSETVCSVDWRSLLDPVPGARIPVIGKHIALILKKGIYRGDRLEKVWGDLLAAKAVRTFGDLRPRTLTVVATDLNHSRGIAIPEALPSYGIDPLLFPVARAVHMSAAIPFLFTPVPLRDLSRGETVLMADGAMAANYPIGLADPAAAVLGFRLDADNRDHPDERIAGPASLARAVMLSGIRARYSLPRPLAADTESIQIPVSTDLDFDMDNEAAREAFDRGYEAGVGHFADHGEIYPSPPASLLE